MAHDSKAYISVKKLKKFHGNREILKGIDLQVDPGELTVLIGSSGCGKSTLLRCLNGLEVLDGGILAVNGIYIERTFGDLNFNLKTFEQKAREIRFHVGMVFQNYNLFSHLTVLENLICAPMVVKGVCREEAVENGYQLLKKVGLADYANDYPSELSGGEQQRAAIARALTMAPKALLYDEPTSALDPDLKQEVLQVMRTLDDEGMTQIVVTHEMKFAKDVADHIVYMQDGVVIEKGVPDEMFSNPNDERTRRFLRNFL
jgi:polar amino acid transport system ATP-binding protein